MSEVVVFVVVVQIVWERMRCKLTVDFIKDTLNFCVLDMIVVFRVHIIERRVDLFFVEVADIVVHFDQATASPDVSQNTKSKA